MKLKSLQSLFLDSYTRRSAGLSGPLPSFNGMPDLRQLYLNSNSLTGEIPFNFLRDVENKQETVSVGLKSNRIEGKVPSSLTRFEKLDIDLTDNRITEIDVSLCDQSGWMHGVVDSYQCSGILCPAGEFSLYGRQINDVNSCKKCEGAENSKFLGATKCQSEVKEREREILLSLYNSCDGTNWKNNKNWLDPEVDICHWFGISCNSGGSVDSILLGSNNLVGTPHRSIFELENLEWLWLYSNPIDFSFRGIGEAKSLASLLLDSTGLKSLQGIGEAYQLTDLDVRFNSISGPIPEELTNLVNLESLSLSDNDFTGAVPTFSRLHRLKSLRISGNRLTSSLPSFAKNKKLKTIDLSDNLISGSIPSNFIASVNEEESIYIDLSRNRMDGIIPESLDRFDKMTIYLKDNLINGIDPELCDNHVWNDGDVGSYQCNGILCPPGTYSQKGRQSRGFQCTECKQAQFYGQTQCVDLLSLYSSSTNMKSLQGSLVILLAIITLNLIL